MKKKTLTLLVALVLVVGCIVGGTLAWLTDKSDPVKNTFTTSDINITLEETKGGDEREFKMIPGWTIEKDPKVTVVAGSEDCYLFVKLEKSANFDDYLTCDMADGWTALENVDGVFYRIVKTNDMGTEFSVLKDNQVTVKSEVTKEMMKAAKTERPTLTVTAYASQLYKSENIEFGVTEAWDNVKPKTP